MHHYPTIGKVLLSQVTNGCCMFSRHLPSQDVQANGNPSVCPNIIYDLLFITKGILDDHLNKLKRVFIRLQDTGLKVNACKLLFCATDRLKHNT